MRISDWSSDVCSSDLSSEWFPQKERSYAIGWVNSATTIGVILTAPTVALFMRVLGFDWRETFIYTGAFGALLLILWLWLYSNPRESGKVSEAELAWIEHDPPEKVERLGWGKIVTKREAWAVAMAKFLTEPVSSEERRVGKEGVRKGK